MSTRVFISYSRRDEAFARRLADSLIQSGMDVWIDQDDISPGEKWSTSIQNALDTADFMLVIISPDSMASKNVEDEWQYFVDNNKTIIPILLHPAKIHFQLSRIQYIDFQKLDFNAALQKLQQRIAAGGRAVQMPPRQPMPPVYSSSEPIRESSGLWVFAAGGLLLLVVIIGIVLGANIFGNDDDNDDPTQEAQTTATATQDQSFAQQPVVTPSQPVTLSLAETLTETLSINLAEGITREEPYRITLRYPEGWVYELDDRATLRLVSNEGMLEMSENEFIQPGDWGHLIVAFSREGVAAAGVGNFDGFVGSLQDEMFTVNTNTTLESESLLIGDHKAVRLTGVDEVDGIPIMIVVYLVEFNDAYLMLSGGSVPDEVEAFSQLTEAIIGTMTITPVN